MRIWAQNVYYVEIVLPNFLGRIIHPFDEACLTTIFFLHGGYDRPFKKAITSLQLCYWNFLWRLRWTPFISCTVTLLSFIISTILHSLRIKWVLYHMLTWSTIFSTESPNVFCPCTLPVMIVKLAVYVLELAYNFIIDRLNVLN